MLSTSLSFSPPSHPMSTAKALSLGKTAAQISAEFIGFPGLKQAVQLLCIIVELGAEASVHRNSISQLRDRCHLLLLTLRDVIQSKPDLQLSSNLGNLEGALKLATDRIREVAKMNKLLALSRQREIQIDFVACHTQIDNCLIRFNLGSHAELHDWQANFEIATRRDHSEMLQKMTEIQTLAESSNGKLDLQADMLREIMAVLQDSLKENHGKQARCEVQAHLYQLQKRSGELLPQLHLEKGEVQRIGQYAVGGNGRMDIWEGIYLNEEKVAIKVVRAANANKRTLERFHREVKIWSKIWQADRGRHVLPFYGFCLNDGPYPYTVSPWQPNGTAIAYVKAHGDEVNYRDLILGIAEGITVLHACDPPVVHGDIKGANIAIDINGNPLIADFGLAKVVEDISGMPFTQSQNITESYRWYAPELCRDKAVMSTASDVYSFSMTVIELMTHESPFHHLRTGTEVLLELFNGMRPERPTDGVIVDRGLDDELWALLNQCWCMEPLQRLPIATVVQKLK